MSCGKTREREKSKSYGLSQTEVYFQFSFDVLRMPYPAEEWPVLKECFVYTRPELLIDIFLKTQVFLDLQSLALPL